MDDWEYSQVLGLFNPCCQMMHDDSDTRNKIGGEERISSHSDTNGDAYLDNKMRVYLPEFVIMIEVNRYIFSNLENKMFLVAMLAYILVFYVT